MYATIEEWKSALEELQKELDLLNSEIAATRLKLSNMENVVNHAQIN